MATAARPHAVLEQRRTDLTSQNLPSPGASGTVPGLAGPCRHPCTGRIRHSSRRGYPAGVPRPSRDRHGRGLRGPLSPPQVPLSRTRAERFDDLVTDAVERLETRWEEQLRGVEFAVEDVPALEGPGRAVPAELAGDLAGDLAGGRDGDPVPLGRLVPRAGTRPARIVVYRRPVETRALDRRELADLVHEVVVEQVADLLGLEPSTVDPGYALGEDDED